MVWWWWVGVCTCGCVLDSNSCLEQEGQNLVLPQPVLITVQPGRNLDLFFLIRKTNKPLQQASIIEWRPSSLIRPFCSLDSKGRMPPTEPSAPVSQSCKVQQRSTQPGSAPNPLPLIILWPLKNLPLFELTGSYAVSAHI